MLTLQIFYIGLWPFIFQLLVKFGIFFLDLSQMATAQYISTILSLVLGVLSICGLVFMTQFAFQSKKTKDGEISVKLLTKSKWAMYFVKLTVVVLWLQLLVVFSGAIITYSPVVNTYGGSGKRVSGGY